MNVQHIYKVKFYYSMNECIKKFIEFLRMTNFKSMKRILTPMNIFQCNAERTFLHGEYHISAMNENLCSVNIFQKL
jgi:hypothetical protein